MLRLQFFWEKTLTCFFYGAKPLPTSVLLSKIYWDNFRYIIVYKYKYLIHYNCIQVLKQLLSRLTYAWYHRGGTTTWGYSYEYGVCIIPRAKTDVLCSSAFTRTVPVQAMRYVPYDCDGCSLQEHSEKSPPVIPERVQHSILSIVGLFYSNW